MALSFSFSARSIGVGASCFRACAEESPRSSGRVQVLERTKNGGVLVLGGTGRVGGSTATATATALSRLRPDLQLIISCRNRSVGFSTAAFALAVLEGSTHTGVWFPEEPEGVAVEAREVLLKRAARGIINFVMNRPRWMVETDPKEVGLGIYV